MPNPARKHPYHMPIIWNRVREFAPWDPEVNRRRPGWRERRAAIRAGRVATRAAVAVARAPLDFTAGVGLGAYRGADYYMDRALAEPEPTWGQLLRRQVQPRAVGETVGMLLHEGLPVAARFLGRAGVASVQAAGDLATRGFVDIFRKIMELRNAPDTRPLIERVVPHAEPDFDAANALWPRLSQLQDESTAEIRRDSVWRGRFKHAFDQARESIMTGQVERADYQLELIEEMLVRIIEQNRQHEAETGHLRRRA